MLCYRWIYCCYVEGNVTTKLKETIAWCRGQIDASKVVATLTADTASITALLDAAEAGMRADEVVATTNDRAREAAGELAKFRAEQARDAALEEAAAKADDIVTHQLGEDGSVVADAIRSLRRPT